MLWLRYRGYTGCKDGGIHLHMHLVFSSYSAAMAFSDLSSGSECVGGAVCKTHYMRSHSNLRRHLPRDADWPWHEAHQHGHRDTTVPALAMTTALAQTMDLRQAVIAYVMNTLEANRARVTTVAVAHYWFATQPGVADLVVVEAMPDLVMVPRSKREDKRGPNATFMAIRHWAPTCTHRHTQGHHAGSMLCSSNP